MRIGTLFSGAGGLDMAVQAVFGGDIVWHSEIDKAASKVLAYRFPGVPNLGDITKVDWADVPAVDVLCGGFPCQDVSAAGKRAGIKDGTRSGLWAVFAEAIDALRPQWVVIENVRGLLSAAAHRNGEHDEQSGDVEPVAAVVGDGAGRPVLRAAGAVLGDLADLGYDAQWATVAASNVGAPHRRERVFIVAYAAEQFGTQGPWGDGSQSAVVGAGAGAGRGDDPGASPSGVRVVGRSARREQGTAPDPRRPAVGLFPGGSSTQEAGAYPGDRSGDHRGKRADVELLPTPNAQDGNGGGRYSSDGHQKTLPGEARLLPTPAARDWKGSDTAGDHSRHSPGMDAVTYHFPALLPTPEAKNSHAGPDYARMNREGSGGHDLVTALTLLCTPSASDGAGGKTSRSGNRIDEPLLGGQAREMASAWGKYAPAIHRWEQLTRPAPAPTEPNKNGNPRLSAAFSEWLMGWPDGWVTDPAIGISRNDQLRIVGNGVCPQQAMAALRYLLSVSVAA